MLFRGAFSLGNIAAGRFFNPLDLRIKPIANTGVVHWGGRSFALHEVGKSEYPVPALRRIGHCNCMTSLEAPAMVIHDVYGGFPKLAVLLLILAYVCF